MSKIYLASGSPRRKELLTQIGISYEVMCSEAEELTKEILPQNAVMDLSRMKAEEVCRRLKKRDEDYIVIGADTVVSHAGRIIGKPKDKKNACAMLKELQGKTHQVYTGVTLCHSKKGEAPDFYTFYESTDVTVYPMSEEEIDAYAETGEPMDKAGAYAIQGGFAAYIKEIRGDYYNVVGLPVSRLYQEMKKRKFV